MVFILSVFSLWKKSYQKKENMRSIYVILGSKCFGDGVLCAKGMVQGAKRNFPSCNL